MPNRQELEQAIVSLEAHRATLGEQVVDISLTALRQQLSSLQTPPVTEQYGQIVVLVADLSGYTVLSEMLDAEELRDTVNAIWERLDAVIAAWGGKIDKHVGDGLIALFGVPKAQADDAERAILAALDMQLELELLSRRSRSTSDPALSQSELKMRIGIDSGPVFFGQVGMNGAYTAIGAPVSQATYLQQSASVGGVLISQQIFSQIHALFELEAQEPDSHGEAPTERIAYRVKSEKRHLFQAAISGVAPGSGRMVGRQSELEQLQQALQANIDGGQAQFLTIIGETGIGKSRLLAEFEQSFKFLPFRIGQFKAHVRDTSGHAPYSLIRQMFMYHFGIHPRSSPAVAREKLAQGIMQVMPGDEAQLLAYCICYLLGFDFTDTPHLKRAVEESCPVREHAYADVVRFFKLLGQNYSVIAFLIEDVEAADEKSLDLLDHVYENCRDQPLLIVCTGRPSLQKRRPSWQTLGDTSKLGHRYIGLAPLSAIDSRHLISQSIPGPARSPLGLTELILERTQGNPAQIAQYTHLLIESRAIVADANKWRVEPAMLVEGSKLPSLMDLLHHRLSELPAFQRAILQRASVIGHTFWKSALTQLAATDLSLSAEQVNAAFENLEQQGLVTVEVSSTFIGFQEYRFGYHGLRTMVYRNLSAARRTQYHAETAAWLIVHGPPHRSDFAGLIASHLEKAGDKQQAAEWFVRAGAYAKAAFAHETAIQRYRQALRLLSDGPHMAGQQMKINQNLGDLLHRQSRFKEAIVTYQQMRHAAHLVGDFQAETAALLGTFVAQIYLSDHTTALTTSRQAEEAAQAAGLSEQLSLALAAQAWSLIHLDDLETSLDMAQKALTIGTDAGSIRGIAYSNALIGGISRIQQWYEQATQATEKALALFRDLGDVMSQAMMLGNLGHIAYAQHDYGTATDYYQRSLHMAQDIGDHAGVIRCFRKLGQITQASGAIHVTAEYYQKAFIRAEKSRNFESCAQIAVDLGWLYLSRFANTLKRISDVDKEYYAQQAQTWLERALFFARKLDIPLVTVSAKSGLSSMLLEFMQPEQALVQAKAALNLARHTWETMPGRKAQKWLAICWRVLGLVASELPSQELPIMIDGRAYDPTTCFFRSLHVFSQMGRGVEAEFACSLRTWADYELREGDRIQGQFLWSRAKDIFGQIGMDHEVSLMNQARLA